MKISEIQKCTLKDQRAILRKITARNLKIAALQAEIEKLQDDLINVAPETGAWWDGDSIAVDEIPTSETPIPLPTVSGEHIIISVKSLFGE